MSKPRYWLALPLAAVGAVVIGGSLAVGYLWQAAFSAVAFPLVVGFVGWSRSSAATTLLDDEDERAMGLARDAAAVAFVVVLAVAALGGITEAARGDVGPWRVLATTASLAFALAFVVLNRRR